MTVNVVEEMGFIADGSKKMEVKWEPFRDIFENIIRPIGGEHDVATMVRNLWPIKSIETVVRP